jgi:hypothetical protein
MPEYLVTIKETNIYGIKVSAKSRAEACEEASDIFGGGNAKTVVIDTTFEAEDAIDIGPLRCHRCGGKVDVSDVDDYTFYCPQCDENLYGFEVRKVK